MAESERIVRGVQRLRRLVRGGSVNLFQHPSDRFFVHVDDIGGLEGLRDIRVTIVVSQLAEVSLLEAREALEDLGWSVSADESAATRSYLVGSDGDLARIASDAHAALAALHPAGANLPLDGIRLGRYADSEYLLLGCMFSGPSLILGLVVGSIALMLWFPGDWDRGPAWIAAIGAAVIGAGVIPTVLLALSGRSDRLHDALEFVRNLGPAFLPAVIGAIALVVATTAQ